MHVSILDRRLTWGFSSSQVYPQGLRRVDEDLVVTRRRTGEMRGEGDPHAARTTGKNIFTSKSPDGLRSLICLFESVIGYWTRTTRLCRGDTILSRNRK